MKKIHHTQVKNDILVMGFEQVCLDIKEAFPSRTLIALTRLLNDKQYL